MIGRQLAHYSILEKFGQGGMGVVYKARDTHLDRFVAIRVLPPVRVADASRKARFAQELEMLEASGCTNPKTAASTALKVRRMVRRPNLPARDLELWLGIFRQAPWKLNVL